MDEKVPMEKYRLEIINEAVLPYIQEMKARIHVDKSRFMQVKEIVSVLTHDFTAGERDNRASLIHPANVLFTIDRVLEDINGHSMLWESKLSKLLRACSKKQWQPILLDTQSSLRSIGGSLIALGMVEVVGRPIVMLYPIYMVISQALKLSKEIELNNNKITVHQYLQIFKIGVYFIFAYLLLTVLGTSRYYYYYYYMACLL
jgi:hypothetical protein